MSFCWCIGRFHVADTVIEVDQDKGNLVKVRIGDVGQVSQWLETDVVNFLNDCETPLKDGGCVKSEQTLEIRLWSPVVEYVSVLYPSSHCLCWTGYPMWYFLVLLETVSFSQLAKPGLYWPYSLVPYPQIFFRSHFIVS